MKAHCTRTRCTHAHTQNAEPTRPSSGPSGRWQQSAGTRVAAEEPSHLELQRRATFLAESMGAMTSALPVMHPGAASGLLPRQPPFSHCPFQGSYSQIRSSENTQILGLLGALWVQAVCSWGGRVTTSQLSWHFGGLPLPVPAPCPCTHISAPHPAPRVSYSFTSR